MIDLSGDIGILASMHKSVRIINDFNLQLAVHSIKMYL